MRKNVYDTASDILKERIGNATALMRQMFKNTNPYRQEPKPDKDRIADYMKWANDPEMEQQLRQQFGDESIDKIRNNMHDLINRGR